MITIDIQEPRYRDRTVLLARYRLPAGYDVYVNIMKGAYKGLYIANQDVISEAPIEEMKTRKGKVISMRAVPLDNLERVKDEIKK